MIINVTSENVTRIKAELLVAGFFTDDRPIKESAGSIDWLYNGVLSKLIIEEKLSGNIGENILLATQNRLPTPKVLFLGMGLKKDFTYSTIKKISKKTFEIINSLHLHNIVLDLFGDTSQKLDNSQSAEAFLNGLPKEAINESENPFTITLLINDKSKAKEIERNIKILSKF